MATLVFVVGKSGRGKSTSCMSLDPSTTAIINSDQQDLPFPSFKKNYTVENGNYLESSDITEVQAFIKEVHANPKIKTLVIDTWTRIMTDAVMSKKFRHAANGMEAWSNMAYQNYTLIHTINDKLRDDIIVYMMCHPETVYDESGFPTEQIAVQGQQLKKFVPESFSTIVLYSQAVKDPGKPTSYYFRTESTGGDSCKTPIGMFEETLIPNDLNVANEIIRTYQSS